jgi:hypothetical protein
MYVITYRYVCDVLIELILFIFLFVEFGPQSLFVYTQISGVQFQINNQLVNHYYNLISACTLKVNVFI